MIPDSAAFERVADTPLGDLAEVPFPVLLVANAAHKRSVLIEVKSGPVTKAITIVDGMPIECRSNLLQDTLGRFLRTRGVLTDEQLAECEREGAQTGQVLETVLERKGLLDGAAISKVLQQSLARKLLDAFAWRRGTFRSVLLSSPPSSLMKIKVAQLVVMGIEKFASEEQIAAAFGPLVGRPLYLNPTPALPLDDLKLTDDQQRLIDGLRQGHRVDELAASASAASSVMRSLYALAVLGHIATEPAVSQVVARQGESAHVGVVANVARKSPPVVPPPSLGQQPQTIVDREDVVRLHSQLKEIDAFDLLDLAPDESRLGRVDEAYLILAKRVAPWSLGPADELTQKATEVFLAASRAYGELSDPGRRATLAANRRKRAQPTPTVAAAPAPAFRFEKAVSAAARDAFRIETELLDPDQQYKRGVKFMEAERYAEAIEQLQYAVDCDPQNSIYRAELARCHYLSSPPVRAASSIRDLEDAVRMDPECGLALFYLGDILAAVGRFDEAQERLKKAARLMLPDRRALDRLNALRAPQARKSLWPLSKG